MLFLFPCSDFHNTRLWTSESCEHIFGNYHKVEREFTVDIFLQIEDMNRHKTMQCMKVTRGCINMTMEVDTRKLMGSLSNRQFPNVIQSVQNKDQSRCMASCHVLNISGTHTCKILIRSISPLDHYLHCLEQHTISRGFIHYTEHWRLSMVTLPIVISS